MTDTVQAGVPAPAAGRRRKAAGPDLSDLSGLAPAPYPDRNLVSSWSAASMDGYLVAMDRAKARGIAELAGHRQATGASHFDVLMALASAENKAPAADKPWHAARLDAYAAAYGLRGWHRGTDHRGDPFIQVNKIRTAEEGDAGRYYTHAADGMHGPRRFWVVDRDTGRTAYRAIASKIARQWIEEMVRAS